MAEAVRNLALVNVEQLVLQRIDPWGQRRLDDPRAGAQQGLRARGKGGMDRRRRIFPQPRTIEPNDWRQRCRRRRVVTGKNCVEQQQILGGAGKAAERIEMDRRLQHTGDRIAVEARLESEDAAKTRRPGN